MTTPTLRPEWSPNGATMKAWADLWRMLGSDEWTSLADVFDQILQRHPTLKRKTIDSIIREARTKQLVQHRGGFSQKTRRDTRQIRRHPKTQEATAP